MHANPIRLTGVLAVVAGLALGSSALAQTDTETVTKTVPFPSGGTLKLRSFSGSVKITGANGRDVVVKAVRHGDRDQLDHIKLAIDTSGSTVTIDANKRDSGWDRHNDNVVRTDFEIEMPEAAALDVDVFSSSMDVRGVTGALKLGSFNGKIVVEGAKGDVSAHTFSGDVEVDVTGAGSAPALKVHTFSGSVHARIAESAKADVAFNSFSGGFDSDLPISMHSVRRGRVSGSLAGGGATLSFETFSGSVRLTK